MVEIKNIRKKYGKREILKGVSIEAGPGEAVAIVGRNGCGKSTLLQILVGIMPPDGGAIKYFNKYPLEDSRVFKKYCGYLPQTNPLIEELTVADNLKLFGVAPDICKNKLFAGFELEPILKMPVSKLSGGMKRRVAIVCTVHHMPPVLFMDEPTSALDIYYRESIHEWIEQYKKMGGILIMATHDETEINMCERRILISEGISSDYKGSI